MIEQALVDALEATDWEERAQHGAEMGAGSRVNTCTACNWHPHDVAVHGETCLQGHPIAVVGRYRNGRCKQCQRDDVSQRRYGRTALRRYTPSASPEAKTPGGRSVAGPGKAGGARKLPPARLPGAYSGLDSPEMPAPGVDRWMRTMGDDR